MRRFMVVMLTVSAVAVTACNRGAPPGEQTPEAAATPAVTPAATVAPPPGGPITVNAFCNDSGPGIGARVHPWRVHTGGATQLTWNIVPVPGGQTMPATLDSVPQKHWAFQGTSIPSSQNTIVAQIKPDEIASTEPDTTYYKLTLICTATNDTIVVDPIVIVD